MPVHQPVKRSVAPLPEGQGPWWHRAETREALIEAARELIIAGGLESVSLARIAEMTGFVPAIVYAYFTRKADLVPAIVAHDLARYAKKLKDDFPFTSSKSLAANYSDDENGSSRWATIEDEHLEPVAPSAHAPAWEGKLVEAETMTTKPYSWDDSASQIAADTSAQSAPFGNSVAELLSQLEARLAQIETGHGEPSLEQRLDEIEHALASVEARIGVAEPAPPVRDDSVAARIDQLSTRLHSIENHFSTQAPADMEKPPLVADAPEASSNSASEAAPPVEESHSEDISPHETFKPAEPVAKQGTEASYLAVARRAALAAETLAHSEERMLGFRIPAMNFSRSPTQFLVYGLVGLGLAVWVAGMFLKHGAQAPVSDTTPTADTKPTVVARAYPTHLADVRPEAVHAQVSAALAFLNGDGVAKNQVEAARLLTHAATVGEPVAEYWLATLYEHGNGEPLDTKQADRLYEASAEQGNLRAMYKIGVANAEGWGVAQNYTEAARWFAHAAELGLINAQYDLGVLYERGLGVPQSLLDAYKWYALAAAQGDKDSAERIDVLSSQLSAEELATAKSAAADFKPDPRNAAANWAPAARKALPPKT